MPTGIWRMPEFKRMNFENACASPLAYTPSSNRTDPVKPFVEALKSFHPDLPFFFLGRLLVTINPQTLDPWKCGIWSDGSSVVFTLPSARDKLIVPGQKISGVFHVGRLGRLEVGVSGPSIVITVDDQLTFPPDSFRFQCSGAYVEVYSHMKSEECRRWLDARLEEEEFSLQYRVRIGPLLCDLSFSSPECKTCLGVHDDIDCPFAGQVRVELSRDSNLDPDIDMTAVDDEPDVNLSFETVKTLLSDSRVLDRTDLVDKIITHVWAKHFLLVGLVPLPQYHLTDSKQIEAPPCSGKTTLLHHVLLTLMKDYPTIGINHLPDKREVVGFKPSIIANHKGPRITNATELAEYVTRLSRPFWLLIDEAQLLYDYEDPFLWKILCPKEPNPNFFVVAAGSYGSHTASLSHSPPSQIEITNRMNLFKTGDHSLALAFTDAHFDAFVELSQFKRPVTLTTKWKKCIKKYASPCGVSCGVPSRGMHPGVVAQMTPFILEQVRQCCCTSS